MHDENEMTPAERAKVLAAVRADQPVRMTRPDGRTVTVHGQHIAGRIAAGYTMTTEH